VILKKLKTDQLLNKPIHKRITYSAVRKGGFFMEPKTPYGIPADIVERERLRVKQAREQKSSNGQKKLPNGVAQFRYKDITYTLSPRKKSPHGLEVKVASKEAAKESRRRGLRVNQTDDLTPTQESQRLQLFESSRLLTDLTGTQHHVEHKLALKNGGSSNNPDNLHVTTDFHNYAKGSSTSGPAFDAAMLNGQRNGEFIRRYQALKLKASDNAQLLQLFAEIHGAVSGELTEASIETSARQRKMGEIARKNRGINGMPDLGITESMFGKSFVQDKRQEFKR